MQEVADFAENVKQHICNLSWSLLVMIVVLITDLWRLPSSIYVVYNDGIDGVLLPTSCDGLMFAVDRPGFNDDPVFRLVRVCQDGTQLCQEVDGERSPAIKADADRHVHRKSICSPVVFRPIGVLNATVHFTRYASHYEQHMLQCCLLFACSCSF